MRSKMRTWRVLLSGIVAAGAAVVGSAQAGAVTASGPVVGAISNVSAACSGQNAEVQTAIDPHNGYLYEEWIGCGGIGFARSTDGGTTFSKPFELPGSGSGWDPAIAVGPAGSVYAAFMVARGSRSYPVVDISADHGLSFPTVSRLVPPRKNNWGDRDFIALGRHGAIYVTWDYGPHNLTANDFVCSPNGSCSFVAGDLNVVLQKSTDGGRTWSKIIPISPGFPGSGADSAPVIVEPSGRLDVLYQGYQVLNPRTLKLGVAHQFFTASTNGGWTWSRPVRVGPADLWMNTSEWWIDGSLARDSAGNLYASWDSQSGSHDIGWLAYSVNGGRTWSSPVRVTARSFPATRLVQVLGGTPGIVYAGLLTNGVTCGSVACYAQYLRVFSIRHGWLTRLIRVNQNFGNARVWPGDTIGLSLFPNGTPGAQQVEVSWGSAIGGRKSNSQVWAAVVHDMP